MHRSQFTHSLIPASSTPPPLLQGLPLYAPRSVPSESQQGPQSAQPSVTEHLRFITGFQRQQEWINLSEQGVHTGEARTRTRSASAPSVHQRPKCLGAGHPQVTSTTTGAKQQKS
ncbi:hypothetical protein OYC64_014448 [Pagothenia borchgrevinki]|uniref:Uncharacterized protein n=1 Tax=Pagothenia borchgrevinki TaxID=8213 RepID=A0ABD2H169_PAGBO